MSELEQTELWKAFSAKADDGQRQMVRELVIRTSARLDLVRDTFPTYTLHNHMHSLNLVRLMDKLLGPDVQQISALEGVILILSAYCHDIGMVFNEEERQGIREENDFERFLRQYPEAR